MYTFVHIAANCSLSAGRLPKELSVDRETSIGVSPRSPSSTTNRRAFVGGCTALAVGLAGCSRLDSSYSSPSRIDAGSDWPHRFRDSGNTNAAPDGPDSLTERWSLRVEARLDRPLVRDGRIITVATTREGRQSFRTRVLAVDAETGDRQWTFELGAVRRARIDAVVDDRVYVVGEALEDTRDQRLYAVETDGSVAWCFDADRITAVTATESTVFVSVRHGSIVALDAIDGESVARLHPAEWSVGRWLSDRTPVGRPTVHEGRVFAPFARYDTDREDSYFDEQIVAFDADGVAWTTAVPDVRFVAGITAIGGFVYVLTADRSGSPTEPSLGSLIALDAVSGDHRWKRSAEGGLVFPIAARGDAITVAGKNVCTFDSNGEQRWQRNVFSGPPVIAGDRVYGRRTEGAFVDTVAAADLSTGDPVDSHTFEYQLNRAPIFSGGRAIARTLEYDRTDGSAEHVADRLHMLQ